MRHLSNFVVFPSVSVSKACSEQFPVESFPSDAVTRFQLFVAFWVLESCESTKSVELRFEQRTVASAFWYSQLIRNAIIVRFVVNASFIQFCGFSICFSVKSLFRAISSRKFSQWCSYEISTVRGILSVGKLWENGRARGRVWAKIWGVGVLIFTIDKKCNNCTICSECVIYPILWFFHRFLCQKLVPSNFH